MARLAAFACLCLLGFTSAGIAESPKRLLLVGQGPDSHPKGTHEYQPGVSIVAKCLKPVKDLEITVVKAEGVWKEGPELIERSDAALFFVSEGARWLQSDPARWGAVQKLAKRGGGLAVIHWGMGCKDAEMVEPFVKLFGACHGGPDRKFQVVETELVPTGHPAATGIKPLKLKEEFYYKLKAAPTIKPIAKAKIDGDDETVCWAYERPDGGRSFGFSGLHFHENWKLPEYRKLISQGVLWTLKLPIPEGGVGVNIDDGDLKLP